MLVRGVHRALVLVAGTAILIGCATPDAPLASTSARAVGSASATARPAPVFSSGFEEGVILRPPELRNGQWRQELSGADRGHEWSALPGKPADLQYLVSGADAADPAALSAFVETRIDTVAGPAGRETRALYQAARRRGSMGSTQNSFIVFDMRGAERGSLRYWIRLQPDLLDLMTQEGDWRVLLEWKETPSFSMASGGLDFQYRWLVTLSRAKPSRGSTVDGIVWKVEGDHRSKEQADRGDTWTDDWTIWNRDVPVPLGEWFLFEVQWQLGALGEGLLSVRAGDRLIAETRNRTRLEWSRGKLYPFMVYMSDVSMARGEAYQWIDDVELWADHIR